MKTITIAQSKRLHALLNQCDLKDEKRKLILAFSSKRCTSSKELSTLEAQELIAHLENKLQGISPSLVVESRKVAELDEISDRMRKKMIYYAYEMQWTNAKGKADMERLNAWCIKSGQFKKALNSHSYEELTKLITQFENVYKSYLKSLIS